MTNMQHYMDDIQDLLEGLDEEMAKRLARIKKWDDAITEKSTFVKRYESIVFDETKSMTERTEAARQLNDIRTSIRDLSEKKTNLAEKNHQTVEKVYARLNELAYNCKCEVEIDNPGCTEQRERAFYRTLDANFEGHPAERMLFQHAPQGAQRRRREYSIMTDDGGGSTRSGTPALINRENITRKRPGRPRNIKKSHFEKFPESSNVSSARSSVEPENPDANVLLYEPAPKKKAKRAATKKDEKGGPSRYMVKKYGIEKLEERSRNVSEVKKEVDSGDYESFALNQWIDDDTRGAGQAELDPEEEKELMDFMGCAQMPLSSPGGNGELDELDVSESFYAMEMYPANHNSGEFRTPGGADVAGGPAGGRGGASSSQRFIQHKSNNATAASLASASSHSDSSIEKRGSSSSSTHRNTLFGSIPETSFSGRHRKLTGRVTEMIIPQRERSHHQKKIRGGEEWCVCNGANTNSDMMVECENKNCPHEWFHFDCVGLSSPPQNEWYCPDCTIQLFSASSLHD